MTQPITISLQLTEVGHNNGHAPVARFGTTARIPITIEQAQILGAHLYDTFTITLTPPIFGDARASDLFADLLETSDTTPAPAPDDWATFASAVYPVVEECPVAPRDPSVAYPDDTEPSKGDEPV